MQPRSHVLGVDDAPVESDFLSQLEELVLQVPQRAIDFLVGAPIDLGGLSQHRDLRLQTAVLGVEFRDTLGQRSLALLRLHDAVSRRAAPILVKQPAKGKRANAGCDQRNAAKSRMVGLDDDVRWAAAHQRRGTTSRPVLSEKPNMMLKFCTA